MIRGTGVSLVTSSSSYSLSYKEWRKFLQILRRIGRDKNVVKISIKKLPKHFAKPIYVVKIRGNVKDLNDILEKLNTNAIESIIIIGDEGKRIRILVENKIDLNNLPDHFDIDFLYQITQGDVIDLIAQYPNFEFELKRNQKAVLDVAKKVLKNKNGINDNNQNRN